MTHYRNSTQIVCDLLMATKECGYEGIKTTALLSKSNLNHGRMQTFLSTLTGSGLVNQIKFDGKITFIITPKGQLFLDEYRRFSDMAEGYGLEM